MNLTVSESYQSWSARAVSGGTRTLTHTEPVNDTLANVLPWITRLTADHSIETVRVGDMLDVEMTNHAGVHVRTVHLTGTPDDLDRITAAVTRTVNVNVNVTVT